MSATVVHSVRIASAVFEASIDTFGIVVRRCSADGGESVRIGRPVICEMEQSELERYQPPGTYVCSTWRREPSICLNDLSDEEVFAFSAEFGIPIDELPNPMRRTFYKSPAGESLAVFVRSHPGKVARPIDLEGTSQGENVTWDSRWCLRESPRRVREVPDAPDEEMCMPRF